MEEFEALGVRREFTERRRLREERSMVNKKQERTRWNTLCLWVTGRDCQ